MNNSGNIPENQKRAFTLGVKNDKFFYDWHISLFSSSRIKIHLLGVKVTMQNLTDMAHGPISAETIRELVGEAMNIPSLSQGQPTQFIILNEIEALYRASEIVPHHPFPKKALAAILVCGDLNGAEDKEKWMFDCETASQQLLLAAHANGLGAHISTIYPDKEKIDNMTLLLALPDNIIAHSYVSMGSPAAITERSEAFNNKRVHFNSWMTK